MKVMIRNQYMPNYYYIELYNKLLNLRQCSWRMDDYFKEMKVAIIQDKVVEDRGDYGEVFGRFE